jgi:phosphoglycolate phosphatase
MDPQLLIFDLDGTLIDSRADLAAAIDHMRGQFGLDPLPLEQVVASIGNGVRRLVEGCLQDASVDLDAALQIYRAYYFSHLTVHTTLYAGVEAGLHELASSGHRLAVLTNKPGEPSRTILNHFALTGLLAAVIGGGDVAGLKPAPDGVQRCLEITGMDPASAWMIGDHCTDLEAARNAGIKSAFVQYGFGEERAFKPDVYFASFSELVGYFV